jgi:hypothetical protein
MKLSPEPGFHPANLPVTWDADAEPQEGKGRKCLVLSLKHPSITSLSSFFSPEKSSPVACALNS